MSKMEMCTVFVTLKIKKECVEDFLKVMETDMIESRKEAGCLRFDVLRQDDPKPGDGEGVEMLVMRTTCSQGRTKLTHARARTLSTQIQSFRNVHKRRGDGRAQDAAALSCLGRVQEGSTRTGGSAGCRQDDDCLRRV